MHAGIAASPNMYLHPCGTVENIPATIAAKNCPNVIATLMHVTRNPRIFGGDASLTYTGIANDATPTPNPTINRPIRRHSTLPESAITIAPIMKTADAHKIRFFRPYRSLMTPEIDDESNAPPTVMPTISSWYKLLNPKSS